MGQPVYTEVVQAKTLTAQQLYKLKRLTFGREGNMSYCLSAWKDHPRTKVVIVFDDTKVISWALMFPRWSQAKPDTNKFKEYDFMIFTRASHRHRGYGKMVYDRAVKVAQGRKHMVVHPWEEVSQEFFKTVHFDRKKINVSHKGK